MTQPNLSQDEVDELKLLKILFLHSQVYDQIEAIQLDSNTHLTEKLKWVERLNQSLVVRGVSIIRGKE